MEDLIAFLRARLDEDAAVAGAASVPSTAAHWSLDEWLGREQPHSLIAVGNATHPTALGHFTADPVPTLQAQHIARHDPARVLAEVDAKRRILNECAYWIGKINESATAKYPYPNLAERGEVVLPVITLLGLPYAEHPEYRDEWRP